MKVDSQLSCFNSILHATMTNLYFRHLPREVDPLVYNMSHEDPGNVTYSEIGGLAEQIRQLREVLLLFPNIEISFFKFQLIFPTSFH